MDQARLATCLFPSFGCTALIRAVARENTRAAMPRQRESTSGARGDPSNNLGLPAVPAVATADTAPVDNSYQPSYQSPSVQVAEREVFAPVAIWRKAADGIRTHDLLHGKQTL
jgi:hypothetical protein